jgi:flagella basal body P-ring formation protein FlgA
MKHFVLYAALLSSFLVSKAHGLDTKTFKVTATGRAEVTVTTPSLRLGDVADVMATDLQHDDEVIGLKKIYLGASPAPGTELKLSAQSVVDKMKAAGVDVTRVGYSFPPTIVVRRAGRPLGVEEVRAALRTSLDNSGRSIELREIRYDGNMWIPPGNTELKAEPAARSAQGLLPFLIKVLVDGREISSRTIEARVDEWLEMPVARRTLQRGELVGAEDISFARLSSLLLPRDAVSEQGEIVGQRAARTIETGEPFRRERLSTPPVIEAGSKVSMVYKNGLFEVSATGVALEAGGRGHEIRVRNEASKKIIAATVLEPGLVGVKP